MTEERRDTERKPVRREEIMLVTIREQRYVSEPIETSSFRILSNDRSKASSKTIPTHSAI